MNFAFISTMAGVPWGGSEELWSQAALRLRQNGHTVHASTPWWPDIPLGLQILIDEQIPIWRREPPKIPLWLRLLKKFGFVREINLEKSSALEWLRQTSPNIVCISDGGVRFGMQWGEWLQELGIPFVMLGQANATHWWPNDFEGNRCREVLMAATASFFVSYGNLRLFEDQLGIAIPRASIMRNPYKVDRSSPIKQLAPHGNGVEAFHLAIIGRLEPDAKGQDIVFHVLALPEWRSRNIQVSIVGGGPNLNNLKLLAERLQIQSKLTFVGHIGDVQKVWDTHHALLLPSRYEGLPLVLVEAMMCGRPAIVTDVAGNAEVVEDGVTGFIAEAATVKHFAQAMERAWTARHQWSEMGRLAAERIRDLVPADPAAVFSEVLIGCCPKA